MRQITVTIAIEAPDDTMFTLDELGEMVEANLKTWEFDRVYVAAIDEQHKPEQIEDGR